MKNQLIILILSLSLLPFLSYGQKNVTKKVLKKSAKELCSCMDLLEEDPIKSAECMLTFSSKKEYEAIDEEVFMKTMRKICPESANQFEELAGNAIKEETKTSNKNILKKAAKELCGCMDILEQDPIRGATCMQEFADNPEYQSIGQEDFMEAMHKACPAAADKFEELATGLGGN